MRTVGSQWIIIFELTMQQILALFCFFMTLASLNVLQIHNFSFIVRTDNWEIHGLLYRTVDWLSRYPNLALVHVQAPYMTLSKLLICSTHGYMDGLTSRVLSCSKKKGLAEKRCGPPDEEGEECLCI